MKKLASLMAAALLFSVTAAIADPVSSKTAALAMCKDEVKSSYADYKKLKTRKIKQTRDGFSFKMQVYMNKGGNEVVQCAVAKEDGTISIS